MYGSPDMLGSAMSSFTKAAGIGAFMEGVRTTTPPGTLDALTELLGPVAPKLMEVLAPKAKDEPTEEAPA
jgi:hypothetical protein